VDVKGPTAAVQKSDRVDDEASAPAPAAEPAPPAEPTPAERRSDSYLTGF